MSQSAAATASLASLSSSVTALRTSLSLLDSSISILNTGIHDFPRLSTVLTTTRHFELTPSSALDSARESLAEELGPAIETLLSKVETYVAKLERREGAVAAKTELLEGRLGQIGAGGKKRHMKSSTPVKGDSEKALR